METVASTLAWLGSTAFRWSAIAFVLLNGLAVAMVFVTRDRSLVNRWTSKLLIADLALVGTGLGVPLLTKTAQAVVQVVSVSNSPDLTVKLSK